MVFLSGSHDELIAGSVFIQVCLDDGVDLEALEVLKRGGECAIASDCLVVTFDANGCDDFVARLTGVAELFDDVARHVAATNDHDPLNATTETIGNTSCDTQELPPDHQEGKGCDAGVGDDETGRKEGFVGNELVTDQQEDADERCHQELAHFGETLEVDSRVIEAETPER